MFFGETLVVKEKDIPQIKGKQYNMKITTWNVRGLCSRFRMYEVWRNVLSEQWDVLCAIEHKNDRNAGLLSYSKGYTQCYADNVHGH